jgi:hypothetical protein
MRGQVVLLEWLYDELEDASSPSYLIYARPDDLYRVLTAVGYVWDTSRRIWRLHRRLDKPRTLKGVQSLKNIPRTLERMANHVYGG